MPVLLPLRARLPLAYLLLATLCLPMLGCASASATQQEAANGRDPLAKVEGEQLYAEGTALAQRGDYVRAEQYLAASMRRGVPAARVLPLLLRVCLAASRLGAALQHAKPHLELHPDDVQLRFLVASLLGGLLRHDEARVELLRVLRDAPNHAGAHYALGLLLREHYRDPDAAAPYFERYLELDPEGLHGAEVAAWLREHATDGELLASRTTVLEAPAPVEALPVPVELGTSVPTTPMPTLMRETTP